GVEGKRRVRRIDQARPFTGGIGTERGNAGGDRGEHHGRDFDGARQRDGKTDERLRPFGSFSVDNLDYNQSNVLQKEKIMARIFDVIEYRNEMRDEIVHRFPETGIGDYRIGSQVIVREAQAAVFFRDGNALDVFKAG